MVDRKTVRDYVWEAMANDTYIVMAKIVAAVALLCAVIMYFLAQEKGGCETLPADGVQR